MIKLLFYLLFFHDVVFNTDPPNLVFWVSVVVDIQTVSIVIASASVVAGVIYYALQIRNQSRVRQTDLTLRLYQQFGSKEFMNSWWQVITREEKDYNEYVKKYGATDRSM